MPTLKRYEFRNDQKGYQCPICGGEAWALPVMAQYNNGIPYCSGERLACQNKWCPPKVKQRPDLLPWWAREECHKCGHSLITEEPNWWELDYCPKCRHEFVDNDLFVPRKV